MSNKYIKEAQKENQKRFMPETYEEFSNLHPSQASLIPMSHIKKLRDKFLSEKTGDTQKKSGDDNSFLNKTIDWD